jgi:proton-translocating NADH-quinone oxidoreductase chain M
MIPFHLWLPEAHVEAPTGISVILASILLKLGSYGFMRYSIALFPDASLFFSPFIITLALLGLVYTSIISLAQVDIKKIIAYSSIGHMNLATIGLFSNNLVGLGGSLYFMVSHGLISGGLFFLVGCLYDRYHTRSFKYYRGLALVYPILTSLFLILNLGNIGVPGTSGFLCEFLTLVGAFEYNFIVGLISSITIVLSPLYTLWLHNRMVFGVLSPHLFLVFQDITLKEFHVVLPLIIGTLFLGLFPYLLLDTSMLSLLSLLY